MSSVILKGENASYRFNPTDPKSVLGEGGMGRVFKGEDLNSGEAVAIKVLFKELTENLKVVQREQQNAQIRVSNPNLIKQLDFIISKGIYHTVSSYFEGEPLDKFIERRYETTGLNEETVLHITTQILNGLEALHNNEPKIIHRDIKPSNVLIDPDTMEIKILDFGIAKIKGDSNKSKTGLGVMMGSPYYSPPEQVKGYHNIIDERADIYSTGILIYELLTGTVPFDGTEFEIMQHQVSSIIPCHPKIKNGLYQVLLKATAKKMEDRFNNAQELKEALLDSEKSVVVPSTSNLSLRMSIRNIMAACIILLVLSTLGAFIIANHRKESITIVPETEEVKGGTVKGTEDDGGSNGGISNVGKSTKGSTGKGPGDKTDINSDVDPPDTGTTTIIEPKKPEPIDVNRIVDSIKLLKQNKKYIEAHKLASADGIQGNNVIKKLLMDIETTGYSYYKNKWQSACRMNNAVEICKFYGYCKELREESAKSDIQNLCKPNCE